MKYISLLVFLSTLCGWSNEVMAVALDTKLPGLQENYHNPVDTIPIKDNSGDYITNPNTNPFDITPSNLTQKVEYDPVTGQYVILEKIGEEYYRTPSYMTFKEYMDWKAKQQERAYFDQLAGFTSGKKSESGLIDPMDKVDIKESLVDRLFGGKEINIQPQGQVDVIMQSTYYNNFIRNNNRRGSTARINPIDPDVKIKVSVDGNIGEKLNIGFNYDTQSTFDFDDKIKLDYDTESFGEDDIIQTVEAGDVNLPLRSNLIQGAQSLFGLKTELKFGHLRLTAIASQQRSEQNNIRIENGASVQEFIITPAEYDENRHFFLSHYNRNTYENNLGNLPQINTPFRIIQLEVWISDDRPTYQDNSTQILALSDLGIGDPDYFTNKSILPRFGPRNIPNYLKDMFTGLVLTDNRSNGIYEFLESDDQVRDIDKASRILNSNGFVKTVDYETFTGRKLNPSEYSYNEKLGFISLNIRLRPNQQLAVAYKYRFTTNPNEIYTVGEITSTQGIESSTRNSVSQEEKNIEPPKVVFTKLLKGSQQRTDLPSWDLMMKNVYSLRANQVNQQDFTFDIFYEDDLTGTLKKFIPEAGFETKPLLQEFGLDRLNEYNDPQPDGIFDFLPGITIIPRSGSVVFPVLEPFGSALDSLLGPQLAAKYKYADLYDTSVTIAKQAQEFNKFRMVGEVKSATSGEISLGPFVPQGSVRVRAGGVELVEGRDYEVDYSIGRLRIINDAYLSQGTPINVSFEDKALFSLQQKTMLGLRADYELSKKMNIGATFLRLKERPFTDKVNIGNDPINNKIFGLDLTYSSEAPWVTNLVDKLPFYSTKEKSAINFTAEGAYLLPGHPNAINVNNQGGGVVNIDDFEGAINGLFLGGFNTNAWKLASVPTDPQFPESNLVNDLRYGANRALLNWYVMDLGSRTDEDRKNPYTRVVEQTDLFDRDVETGNRELLTFDLSYYPTERGPYNFDVPNGYEGYTSGVSYDDGVLRLNDPEDRWAGIMRYFQNPDFEAANYEFVEFWMLNPYMDRPDGEEHTPNEEGEIIFNLGNVSEDIVKDNYQFYENAIPLQDDDGTPVVETNWGIVPLSIPVANGFDIDQGDQQDLGYNGLNDADERTYYQAFLQALVDAGFPPIQSVSTDPANDNFEFDRTGSESLLKRYKKFNNPQGNAPVGANRDQTVNLGNRFPDSEDLNNNRSLDEGEGYYKYVVKIRNNGGELDTTNLRYFSQSKLVQGRNGGPTERWYRFRIPLNDYLESKNINGFRSIQFMRMYLTGFSSAKTFRLAEFQILRNLWRRSDVMCDAGDGRPGNVRFSVDEVGIEENSKKQPFGYLSPSGIQQERRIGTFSQLVQDEKSMSLIFDQLENKCDIGINKIANLDLNLYKRLQLFSHAEANIGDEIEDGDLSLFIRFGKDLVNHYYEYELPLTVTKPGQGANSETLWPIENNVDVAFEYFKEAKINRIESNFPLGEVFSMPDPDKPGATINVKGTPNLSYIKIIEIGVRNNTEKVLNGEVWVNELRAAGLNEKGGYAAQARMQVQMADLGEINLAGSYSSIGWGALDQSLQERNREELLQYDLATNLQLGKFFGKEFGLSIPFYAQYSRNIAFDQFEPYEGDLTPDQKIQALQNSGNATQEEIADIKDRSKRQTTVKTFNFTNVKKEGKGGKPWSVSNFSGNYAYTETNTTDQLLKEDRSKEYTAGLDYNYSTKPKYIQPFKNVKNKQLKIVKEVNFNPLPNRFTFNTSVNRLINSRTFRLPEEPVFLFDNKRFFWDRNYGLNWDLTKALKLNFSATASSIVDELRQTGIAYDPADRDWVDENGNDVTDQVKANPNYPSEYRNDNIRDLGRNKNYNHNVAVNYTLPLRYLPYMDWVVVKADYNADYGWTAGSLAEIDVFGNTNGNVIQNGQSRSLKANVNFDKLYAKFKYLKKIEAGKRKNSRPKSNRKDRSNKGAADTKDAAKKDGKKRKGGGERSVSGIEKILVRPLLSLRSVNLTYREDLGTVLPGFLPNAELLGLENGFNAPGWGFALGLQPNLDNFLYDNQSWFNPSLNFSDQITQSERQTIDLRVELEPFRDLDIDIDFSKSYQKDHSEEFKYLVQGNGTEGFSRVPLIDVGSFNVTHWGLSTLFQDNLDTYRKFLDNRVSVSHILAGNDDRVHSIDNPEYAFGYGPESNDVIVPAFLAAYTGQSTGRVTKNLQNDVSKLNYIPKPNWNLRYDGLSKLDIFKDVFSSVTINHAYRSTLSVNRFNTSLDYQSNPTGLNTNDNYYAEIEIPAVAISEQFAPLIGVSLKTKSDFTLEAEYRKSRRLQLSLQELSENLSTEVRLGVGYIIKNFRGGKEKKGKRRGRSKSQEKDDIKDDKKNIFGSLGNRVNNNRGKTLTFNLDFSISDNVEYIYKYSTESPPQPNSGSWVIQIAPNVIYDINENFALRFFVNYNDRRAKATVSVPRTLDIRGGVTAQLKIN